MGHAVCFRPEKCVGCRACEMICSLTNSDICSTEKSHIRVNFDMFTAKVDIVFTGCIGCRQCITYCPENVLKYEEAK